MRLRSGILVLCLCAPLPLTAGDWPHFLGPNFDSATSEKLLTKWGPKGPAVLWSLEVGEGYSAPVVVGDRVVLFHRLEGSEVLDCLDAKSGKRAWRFGYECDYEDALGKGNGPRATPVIAKGKVFSLGAAGHLTCVDFATGKKVWQRNILADFRPPQSFFGIGTSPLVFGGRVVVNVGAENAGIVAFDSATGKELWKATSDEGSYATPIVATVGSAENCLVFFTRAGLVVLSPEGKVLHKKRWRARLNASVNAASPIASGGSVFLTSSYRTGAIRLKATGDKLETVWTNDEVLSCHFNTPVLRKGYLYGIDGRQETRTSLVLRCVDWKTGKATWKHSGLGCASIIRFGDHLLILSEAGELVLAKCDPEKYREIARADILTGPVRAHAAVSNGRLFARGGGKLVCLRVGE